MMPDMHSFAHDYIGKPFHLLKADAHIKGLNAEYGQRYSTRDLRDNIRLGNIPAIPIKGETCLVIGESDKGFLLQKADGMTATFSDVEMSHLWPGEATIFFASEKVADKYKRRETIILDGIRSDWVDADRHDVAMRTINLLEKVPQEYLPSCPTVLVLQENLPGDDTWKNTTWRNSVGRQDVRAYSIGATMFLLDKSDPMTEIYHELGHVYWNNRLTEDEKKTAKQVWKELDKENPPGIVQSPYEISDEQEFFCTLYMWMLKGFAVSNGYQEILETECPAGAVFLRSIASRIVDETETQRIWDEHKAALASSIKSASDRPQIAQVNGVAKRVKLAKASGVIWPAKDLRIPGKAIDREFIGRDGLKYVSLKDGLFDEIALPVRGEFVAFDVLSKAGKRAGQIPVCTAQVRPGIGIVIRSEWHFPSEARPENLDLLKARKAKAGDVMDLDGERHQKQEDGSWLPIPNDEVDESPAPQLHKARSFLQDVWQFAFGRFQK